MFKYILFAAMMAGPGLAKHVPDEVIVLFRPEAAGISVRRALDSIGAREIDSVGSSGPRLVKLPAGTSVDNALAALRAMPEVEEAEPNGIIKAALVPDDTCLTPADQWYLYTVKAVQSWSLTVSGCEGSADVVIAIVDSGIYPTPVEILPKLTTGYNAFDGSSDAEDDNGHGTMVAGVAAAETNNGTGVAGVAWRSLLMPIKVLDSTGAGTEFYEMKGVDWASRNGAKVINMSLGSCDEDGCPPGNKIVAKAMEDAYKRGCVLVASAGNEATGEASYPAAYPYVIGVAATDKNDQPAYFSNFGFYVDVAAPGIEIRAVLMSGGTPVDCNPSYFVDTAGTSFSAPIVAGLAAVLFSQDPSRTNDEIVQIIQSTADQPWGTSGWNQYYGYGRVNMYRALTGAAAEPPGGPVAYNYPNPFSPDLDRFTTFVIKSGSGKNISIEIYAASGDKVWTKSLSAAETAGMDLYYNSPLRWDGKDSRGKDLANGIYFASVKVDSSRTVKKIVIAR